MDLPEVIVMFIIHSCVAEIREEYIYNLHAYGWRILREQYCAIDNTYYFYTEYHPSDWN